MTMSFLFRSGVAVPSERHVPGLTRALWLGNGEIVRCRNRVTSCWSGDGRPGHEKLNKFKPESKRPSGHVLHASELSAGSRAPSQTGEYGEMSL